MVCHYFEKKLTHWSENMQEFGLVWSYSLIEEPDHPFLRRTFIIIIQSTLIFYELDKIIINICITILYKIKE